MEPKPAYVLSDFVTSVPYFNHLAPDTQPPEITGCSDDISATTELGTSGTIVSWPRPQATDRAGVSETTVSHRPGTMFAVGTNVVAYIFRDPSGNTATCTFSVTVETGWLFL